MVQTITPVVHGGRRSWRRSVGLHAVGATVSAAALGAALGGVGLALGAPWGAAGPLVVAVVAVAYIAREALGLRVPIPEMRRQVPEWWRSSFSPGLASFLYGLGLGVGFGTHLRHGTLVAVAAAAVASGDPILGAIVIAPFGIARASTLLTASGATTSDRVATVTDRIERWARGPASRAANSLALAGVGIAAVVAVVGDGGNTAGTSGLAPLLLAAVFAWAAVAKLTALGTWRGSLRGYALPRPIEPAVAAIVPLVEVATAAALLLHPTVGASAVLALSAAFSAALVRARRLRGDRVPCGCFGGSKTRDVRLMLWRNAVLAGSAILVVAAPAWGPIRIGLPSAADAAPALLTLVALVLAAVAGRHATRLLAGAQS